MATAAKILANKPAHVPTDRVVEFDYIDDAGIIADPHARMREIAQTTPGLFWTPHYGGHWVARSRAVLAEVTTSPDRFSSKSRGIPAMDHDVDLIPLTMDPPEHSHYRIPINPLVSPKGVAPLEPSIREMANDLIDAVIAKGRCDFLHEVAEPLPVILFMRLAGMPTDRLAEFRQLAEQATAAPEASARSEAFVRIGQILAPIVQSRMVEPQDDLISKLYAAGVNGRKMTFEELLNYSVLLFLGGLETVVNALAFSTRYLAMHPDIQQELREDPTKIATAIDELLRLHGIAFTVRRTTADTELDGVLLKADDMILIMAPAANYDETFYPEAASFCPARKQPHVTFNMGAHRCMGANLARLEMRVFFEQWLARVPPFRLDPESPPVFFGGLNLAIRSLGITWA
jgi:cytochrome P450